ncbi:LLM class flavin-dependent oxidoreductase [Fodinicola acaciae]|uniref:LLM class flavin-dependent oxidoreductase n=1 Tax=Fodinicola acaciae TaxID=2681555 RepID=UPI0013D8345A|nr:LLM class flavin-dependent oxidoreductase [Fodinicola acaciae]
MRYGICIPQFVPDGFDPAAFRDYLRRAEELGFESAWTQEQHLGDKPILGAVEVMTYAAACTERIRIGCSVFVTPLHQPVELAKSLSTLDQLSQGRLEVGVGTGGNRRPFGAFGITADGLVARFNEHLRIMRALWREQRVTIDGRFWQLENAMMEPKPVQAGGPPVWFGGSAPAALKRAVQHGDGFFGAGSTTTAKFAEQVKIVREEAAAAGRDDFPIAKRVYIAVDDDTAVAKERMRIALDEIYHGFGLPDLTPVSVFGTPEECVAGLRAVAEAGAERILVNPLFDQREQMERLSADVLPHVS